MMGSNPARMAPAAAVAQLSTCVLLALAPAALGAPVPPPTPVGDPHPGLSSVTVEPASGVLADGLQEVTVTVTVRDGSGAPVPELIVRVTSSDPIDMIAQPVAPTDASGVAIATIATKSPGTKTISATVDPFGSNLALNDMPTVEFDAPEVQPNIIIVLLDDVGTDWLSMYEEVNPYRTDMPYVHGERGTGEGDDPVAANLYIQSPALNQLASEGVTFLNAYAMPVCSPTRAAILTGNYPVRTGIGLIVRHDHLGGTLNEFGDPGFEFPTLPQITKPAGYDDIVIGKWHMGLPTTAMDPQNGNDGRLAWATIPQRGYFSEWMCVFNGVDNAPLPPGGGSFYNFYLNRNHVDHAGVVADGPETQFATSVQFDEALAWCNSRTKPFLCVLTPNAAHAPWGLLPPPNLVWTEEYTDPPLNGWSGQLAAIEALDSKIGDLWNGLHPEKRAKTTIIVLGDNGTPTVCLVNARQTGHVGGVTGSEKDLGQTYDFLLDFPRLRFKNSVYEKGSRVPMIVAGYGVNNPGRMSKALVDATDIFPTVVEMLGIEFTGDLHGKSMLPVLQDTADYQDHARDFTFTETFLPLGSTGPGINFTRREIGCSLIIPGQGRYKIVYNQDLAEDEFYKIQDAAGDFVDPFETVNLPHGPADPEYGNYLLVLARMQEIVASGDATGPQPCSLLENFCSSSPNSTGMPAVISADGTCSISQNRLRLLAQPVPNQFGIFFYSTQQVNGGNGVPYGNGLRCVGGPGSTVYRLPITMAEDNLLDYKLDLQDLPPGGDILPGSTWHFQAWFRDPDGGGSEFDLSDGLTASFGP